MGDININVYNNHMVIWYNKYNKIGQYESFSVIKVIRIKIKIQVK